MDVGGFLSSCDKEPIWGELSFELEDLGETSVTSGISKSNACDAGKRAKSFNGVTPTSLDGP